jgi:hypothetical protein
MINTRRGRSAAFPTIRWSGHWIAPEPEGSAEFSVGFGGDVPPHEFTRVQFRKTFTVSELPSSAPLRLTADSRYVLYVNGNEVGRGPIRSQPRRQRFDEYDIADVLVAGENTIAVLVTYYGAANAFWQPAASNGNFGTDAILVLEARIGGELLVSDDSWKFSRSTGWAAFPKRWIDGVPAEKVDAREFDADWFVGAYDDSAWATATIMKTSHIGGFAESRPPTDPFGALLSRGVSALTGETVGATELVDNSSRPRPSWDADHPALRAKQLLHEGGTGTSSGTLPTTVSVDGSTVQHIAVDFGRILAGFVELDVDAPAGTVFDLYYREKPWDARLDAGMSSPDTAARYVARGTADEFRALEINGLRYLHLVVSNETPVEATITGIRVREFHYPQSGDAFFRSNDAEIDALYRAGIRTVTMNAFDSFTDCPTREQRAWVGDGVVHQMVHLTTNSDWGLARNYVALGNSPRSDGMLPMTVVGEIEVSGGLTIPDWALHWVHGVYNLYRYVGDVDEIRGHLRTVEDVLRWYEAYVDERGTISDVPEWNLVDWASVFSTGRSSILTALWARGLREFAELSEWVGNNGSAAWARGLWENARVGFEDFWDPARGRYIDHFVDGVALSASSQAAGATAIVSGLAPQERWNRIIDGITDESTLVVRSWIGSEDGGYDQQKMEDQSNGVQRIDWDAEREVVLAEPFFSYVVHDAVAAAGRGADLVTLMRRWSVFLTDGYDTFGECWGWGTPVHGWSSTPTRDLVQHVLGVTPAEPGFAKVRFAPALGSLTEVQASVPTPNGYVSVAVKDGRATIESPVPVVYVSPSGSTEELAAGRSEVAL